MGITDTNGNPIVSWGNIRGKEERSLAGPAAVMGCFLINWFHHRYRTSRFQTIASGVLVDTVARYLRPTHCRCAGSKLKMPSRRLPSFGWGLVERKIAFAAGDACRFKGPIIGSRTIEW